MLILRYLELWPYFTADNINTRNDSIHEHCSNSFIYIKRPAIYNWDCIECSHNDLFFFSVRLLLQLSISFLQHVYFVVFFCLHWYQLCSSFQKGNKFIKYLVLPAILLSFGHTFSSIVLIYMETFFWRGFYQIHAMPYNKAIRMYFPNDYKCFCNSAPFKCKAHVFFHWFYVQKKENPFTEYKVRCWYANRRQP